MFLVDTIELLVLILLGPTTCANCSCMDRECVFYSILSSRKFYMLVSSQVSIEMGDTYKRLFDAQVSMRYLEY